MTEYFPYSELPVVGTKIKTLVEFSGVPEGTIGVVVASYHHDKTSYGVDIRWNRWENDRLTDGFSKSEYFQYLQEIKS